MLSCGLTLPCLILCVLSEIHAGLWAQLLSSGYGLTILDNWPGEILWCGLSAAARKGEMGIVVWVSYAFQQCKSFENPLRFDKVAESLKVGTFFVTHSVVTGY